MKILKYTNRKIDDTYWDASTPEKETVALRCLFKELKYWNRDYADLKDNAIQEELKELEELEKQLKDGTIPAILKADVEQKVKYLRHKRNEIEDMKYQKQLYEKANQGDDKALKALLSIRQNYEYEEWEVLEVLDPFATK